MKQFEFEYGQVLIAGVQNVTANKTEFVESPTYDRNLHWRDLIVNIDLSNGSATETPILDIQNSGSNPFNSTFQGQVTPSGTRSDYFRFSLARSSTGWNYDDGKGSMLARLFFDRGINNAFATRYYDPISQEGALGIKVRRYDDALSTVSGRFARVGVELMRPNEPVNGSVVVADSINIAGACFTIERDSSIQSSVQYLNASCSAGSNRQFAWQTDAGAPFTALSSDTLFELSYLTTGSHTVTLKLQASGITTFVSKQIQVISGTVDVSGPTCVNDKLTKKYNSSLPGSFFERFADPVWWFAAGSGISYYDRIWPAGNYTVDVRGDASTASVLQRGQARVTVKTTSCVDLMMAAQVTPANIESNVAQEDGWSFFGAGPVFTIGGAQNSRTLSLYDIAGAHETNSPFASPFWFSQEGEATTAASGAVFKWKLADLAQEHARIFQFAVDPGSVPGIFGFAWDPDFGRPEDDEAGWDTSRKMVYGHDDDSYIGLMLVRNGVSQINGVTQYGVKRRPPVSPDGLHAAQLAPGLRLLSGRSDIQFIVSAKPMTGAQKWHVVFVKGSTLLELQQHADWAISSLVN